MEAAATPIPVAPTRFRNFRRSEALLLTMRSTSSFLFGRWGFQRTEASSEEDVISESGDTRAIIPAITISLRLCNQVLKDSSGLSILSRFIFTAEEKSKRSSHTYIRYIHCCLGLPH
jgi:hypothetical protein